MATTVAALKAAVHLHVLLCFYLCTSELLWSSMLSCMCVVIYLAWPYQFCLSCFITVWCVQYGLWRKEQISCEGNYIDTVVRKRNTVPHLI